MRVGIVRWKGWVPGIHKGEHGNETSAKMRAGSLEVKLLNVPLPERKVARWALPLPCGYSGVHAVLAERVHALRQNRRS